MASIGENIGAFFLGLAGGAAEQHTKNVTAERVNRLKLQQDVQLKEFQRAVESGDVGFVESQGKFYSSLFGKDAFNSVLERTKFNMPQAKLGRSLSALTQMGINLPGAQQPTQPTAPSAIEQPPQPPVPGPEAFRGMIGPSQIQEETLPARPTPAAPTAPTRPAPPAAAAPAPRPATVPPAQTPFEPKGFSISGEGEVSFQVGLRSIDERVQSRIQQLEQDPRLGIDDIIGVVKSEGLPIKPQEETALKNVFFMSKMDKFLKDNRDALANLPGRTKLLIAAEATMNITGSGQMPDEVRRIMAQPQQDVTPETAEILRSRGIRPEFAQPQDIAEARGRKQLEELARVQEEARIKRRVELEIPERPSAVERKESAKRLSTFDTLGAIRSLFSPRFIGAVRGRLGGFAGKTFGTSVEESQFRAEVQQVGNAIANDLSGAAISPEEAVRIFKEIPEATDPPTTFAGKFIKTWRNSISIQLRKNQIDEESSIVVPPTVKNRIAREIREFEKFSGQKFAPDERITNPATSTAPAASTAPTEQLSPKAQRFEQLIKEGKTQDEAVQTILKEFGSKEAK